MRLRATRMKCNPFPRVAISKRASSTPLSKNRSPTKSAAPLLVTPLLHYASFGCHSGSLHAMISFQVNRRSK
ncbi:hypothetical protein Pdw03_0625 [Penicillium digitatum]|uniref:Uncharacterized protein n=1 Tax=Penicillium digitatum TaxID=36651 RepID=A0A7T7BMY9_PENDI|nr:hypothetical protein Pdw03_0625 [Penicillium digitatum]